MDKQEVPMKKRKYTKKQIVIIILLSVGMIAASLALNHFYPPKSSQTSGDGVSAAAVTDQSDDMYMGGAMEEDITVSGTSLSAVEQRKKELDEKSKTMATFLQGPKSWKERREWSGKWGKEMYDGSGFGGFGCGLCCMANIYSSFSPYACSPVDMYKYAKKTTGYGGYGAIDWGYMKETLKGAGFTSDVWRKPKNYEKFQEQMAQSLAAIVVVSSNDSDCYWQNTPGHYVTILQYNKDTDEIFLGDSGDPSHNRQWVALKKIYKSLKKANNWQYLAVTSYEEEKNTWKHNKISDSCVLPQGWQNGQKPKI